MKRSLVVMMMSLFLYIDLHAIIWVDEAQLLKEIQKNPKDVKALMMYSRMLMEQNNTAKAEEVLKGKFTDNAEVNILRKKIAERKVALKTFAEEPTKKVKANITSSNLVAVPVVAPEPFVTRSVIVPKVNSDPLLDALVQYQKSRTSKNAKKVTDVYTMLGKEERKIEFLREHCHAFPTDIPNCVDLSRLLSWKSEYTEALKLLESREYTKDMAAVLLRGEILSWKGEYAAAKKNLELVVQNGNSAQQFSGRKSLAFIARWEGDTSKAKKLFVSLHQEDPSDKEIAEEVMVDNKEFPFLIDEYEKRLIKEPENSAIIERIAFFLQQSGHNLEAVERLKILYAKTHKVELLRQMGELSLQMKQNKEGLAYLEEYAIKHNTPQAWLEYGKNLYWLGEFDKALLVLPKRSEDAKILKESWDLIKEIHRQQSPQSSQAVVPKQESLLSQIESFFVGKSASTTVQSSKSEPLNLHGSSLGILAERLTDNAGLQVDSAKIRGVYQHSPQMRVTIDVGEYQYKNSTESLNGNSGFISVGNDNIEAGAFVDTIGNGVDIHPYLRLTHAWAPHSVSLSAYQRNVGFIKNAITPINRGNILTSVQLSDYALFDNGREFWGALEFAWDEENNTIVTPQFQYRFAQYTYPWITWSPSLQSWATFNSTPNTTYYSPSSADGTYGVVDVSFPLTNRFSLDLMSGLGYSFVSNLYLYKWGAWITRKVENGFDLRGGCSKDSSQGQGSGIPYAYTTCNVNVIYRW